MSTNSAPLKDSGSETKYLRYSWKVLFGIGILSVADGVFALIGSLSSSEEFFEMTTGVDWNEFSTTYPGVASYFHTLDLSLIVFLLTFGPFGSAVAWNSFKNGEKWAWFTMWLFPINFGFLSIIFLTSEIDQIFAGVASGIFCIIAALAIILPYREFFAKSTKLD